VVFAQLGQTDGMVVMVIIVGLIAGLIAGLPIYIYCMRQCR